MRIVQVGHQVVPEAGGTTKAIHTFREVLGGSIVSFTFAPFLPEDRGDVVHVPVRPGLLGSKYGWSAHAEKARAEHLIREADLIVIHNLLRYHAQWAWSVARRFRIPYWVVPHGVLDPYVFSYRALQKRGWMAAYGNRVLQGAARVVFATERERAKAGKFASDSQAVVLHWPVGCPDPVGLVDARFEVRMELGVPPEARVLLVVGRLHPSKRILETLEALETCADPRLHLVIMGPDSEELSAAECRAVVRDRRIAGVHFLGPIFGLKKFRYFAAADALLSLSGKENFGYSVAEGLACGLPVILSPGVDLAADLKKHGCGWFLDSLDLSATTEALRGFAGAPTHLLKTMGARGRAWAREHASFDSFSSQLTSLAECSIAST